MPGMNVRGDRYLNFTPAEAAAWLTEVEVQHHANEDRAGVGWYVAGFFGATAICIVLAMIFTMTYATLYVLAHPQMASDVTTPSAIQRSITIGQGIQRADFHRPNALSSHSPTARNLPGSWFLGRLVGELPLSDAEGRTIGALPNGTKFFGTAAASAVQLIVAADGSSWGYGELLMPEDVSNAPIAVEPAWEKAAALIAEIEASGIADALRNSPKPKPPKDGYLPAGWTSGCLDQDKSLAYGVYGIELGTVPKGTCLLYEIRDVEGWRLVVAPDGSYRGYAHLPVLYEVPKRTPMQPEYRRGVALIHRLEDGRAPSPGLDETRQALAKNMPTPSPDHGEEQ